jgi:ABC-type branched-subunit amino acid transport system ATPase component/ABC-type branched-subunit amino acid transport system permease subunit
VGLLALVPVLVPGAKLGYFTIALTQMIVILSLGLLVRTSGLVSLCSAAFAAIGAVAFSQLAVQHGVPWLLALVLASLIVVPVGALVAIPAIRLSGLFLALATFGFGIMVERLFYARGWMFTVLASGRSMPRPSLARGDTPYYYVVLGFVVVTGLVMVVIHQSRLGRILRGMSESPVAVVTMGLSTNTTRVLVFAISSFLAGMGGILYGSSIHFAVSGDIHYQSFNSLILLAVLALAPFAEPWYALFALPAAIIPAYLTGKNTPYWLNVIFGVFAISVALQGGHPSMPARLRPIFERFGRQRRRAREPIPAVATTVAPSGRGLEVEDLTVRFGGLVAVDKLTFKAPLGRITGLIGPNGAGKTTTFDACGGLNRRVAGRITLNGADVTGLGPAARARHGIGRTFQRMQLGDSLTVADNVALGRESGQAGGHLLSQVVARPRQIQEVAAATQSALEVCGLEALADVQAGALSTGQRRLVELARCLAGPFDVLLLDEPSSGLDHEETVAFDEVLRRVVAERGCAILLVEHDMSLVMNICDYIYVLDFGRLIFEGTPDAVASSPIVQAAYLGAEALTPVAGVEVTL